MSSKVRFEVFVAVKIQVTFCVVILCSNAEFQRMQHYTASRDNLNVLKNMQLLLN